MVADVLSSSVVFPACFFSAGSFSVDVDLDIVFRTTLRLSLSLGKDVGNVLRLSMIFYSIISHPSFLASNFTSLFFHRILAPETPSDPWLSPSQVPGHHLTRWVLIELLCTDDQFRGRGVGKLLLAPGLTPWGWPGRNVGMVKCFMMGTLW